jgi:hypothetical protein
LNGAASLSELAGTAMSTQESFDEKKAEDSAEPGIGIDWIQEAREAVLSKGQSKRIWNELYKVFSFHSLLTIGHRFFRRGNQCSRCP